MARCKTHAGSGRCVLASGHDGLHDVDPSKRTYAQRFQDWTMTVVYFAVAIGLILAVGFVAHALGLRGQTPECQVAGDCLPDGP